MTISLGNVATAETTAWPRLPLTFATLMTALRSGNLDAARQAFSDLQPALQPHLSSVIAPVGTALGQGETAQAGKLLSQLRGVIAAAAIAPLPAADPANPSSIPSSTLSNTQSAAPPTVAPTPLPSTVAAQTPLRALLAPSAAVVTASAALGRLV